MSTQETRHTHVVLPQSLLDEIDRVVGKRRRRAFVVEAVNEKLRGIRLLESAKSVAGSLQEADLWETEEDTDQYVRGLREGLEEQLGRKRSA
jgi:metal-responsive CopG/Arc/MetJ family transcriptional regulator